MNEQLRGGRTRRTPESISSATALWPAILTHFVRKVQDYAVLDHGHRAIWNRASGVLRKLHKLMLFRNLRMVMPNWESPQLSNNVSAAAAFGLANARSRPLYCGSGTAKLTVRRCSTGCTLHLLLTGRLPLGDGGEHVKSRLVGVVHQGNPIISDKAGQRSNGACGG